MKNLPALFVNLAVGVLGLCGWSACALTQDGAQPAFTVARRHFTSEGTKILVDVYTPANPLRREAQAERPFGGARLRRARGAMSAATLTSSPRLDRSFAPPNDADSPPPQNEVSTDGRHPRVLVLHGAGGMLFDGPEMSRVAQDLATAGFEAYQVHYFDRTGTWFARQAVLLKLFPTWRKTVHDAVEWTRKLQPEAPSVGIFGYSLGAFAAIEEARRNRAIGAVVAQAGGFWHAHPEGATRQPMPPLLIIQGFKDRRVSFAKYTEPLLAFLRAHHDPLATRFYPDEGHDFRRTARAQVRRQAVAFFRQHFANPRKQKVGIAADILAGKLLCRTGQNAR